MHLFNVYKNIVFNKKIQIHFSFFFGLNVINHVLKTIVHVQLWKILEFKKEKEKTRLKFILIVAQVGIFNGKDDGWSSTRKPFSTFTTLKLKNHNNFREIMI